MSTPMYAANAAALVPEARLVVSLRNPVHRAYSHYQHMRHHAMPERLSFRAALEREQALLDAGLTISEENFSELAPLLLKFGYLNRGRYALEIAHWLRYFPREQFLFLNFDAWKNSPEEAAARIARHIGLPDHDFHSLLANRGTYRQPLPRDCEAWLKDYYRPWNRATVCVARRRLGLAMLGTVGITSINFLSCGPGVSCTHGVSKRTGTYSGDHRDD